METKRNNHHNDDDCELKNANEDVHLDSFSVISLESKAAGSVDLSLPASFAIQSITSQAVGSPTAAEVKLLRLQILESRALVKSLISQQRHVLQSLASSNAIMSRDEYIKVSTKPNKTFEESISLVFYEQMTSMLHKLEHSEITAKENLDMVNQQKRHVQSLEESLTSERQRRIGIEQQVDRIQNQLVDYQEKARLYDEVKGRNVDQAKEIERLRDMLERSKLNLSNSHSAHVEDKEKLDALQHKIESMEVDMRFLEKEKHHLEDRATRAENAQRKSEQDISDLELKVDSLSMELEDYKVRGREKGIEKHDQETQKIREEFIKEMTIHRKSLESLHEREIYALNESKSELIKRCEKCEKELEKSRSHLELLKSEKDEQMIGLERTLLDSRSELKVKCVENTRMASTIQTLEEELKQNKAKVALLIDQVDAQKAAFNHLENESIFQLKRLQDEISRKDEELDVYHQIVEPGCKPGEMHLLGKYKILHKRYEELQRKSAYLQGQLKNQTQSCKVTKTAKHSNNSDTSRGKVTTRDSSSYSCSEEKTNQIFRNDHYVWNAHSIFVSCNPSDTLDQNKHTTHYASKLSQQRSL